MWLESSELWISLIYLDSRLSTYFRIEARGTCIAMHPIFEIKATLKNAIQETE